MFTYFFVKMDQQSNCLIIRMYLIHAREKIYVGIFLWFCIVVFCLFFIYILNQPALKTRTELPCNL